jgi:hypothetical protein
MTRKTKWLIAIGIALPVIASMIYGLVREEREGIWLHGTAKLGAGAFIATGTSCQGRGDYSQFGPGGGIVVTGDTTDSDSFDAGRVIGGMCELTFLVRVVPAEEYRFTVSGVSDRYALHDMIDSRESDGEIVLRPVLSWP